MMNLFLSSSFIALSAIGHAFVLLPNNNKPRIRRHSVAVSPDSSSLSTPVTHIQIPHYDTNDDDDDDHNNNEISRPYPSLLHSIYVKSILNDDEVQQLRKLACLHAESTGQWNQPDADRHVTYPTCDFPVDQAPRVQDYLDKINFDERIWDTFQTLYQVPAADLAYLDLFCAQYRAKPARSDSDHDDDNSSTTMDRLEAHRDGSLLSFTITLTSPNDYTGGGTFFEALRGHEDDIVRSPDGANVVQPNGVIRPTRAGDGVFHCGKVLHGAEIVTAGERIVLVGFVDVNLWHQRPGVLANACRAWGRMDVAEKRFRRLLEQTRQNNSNTKERKGWFAGDRRHKWLSSATAAIRSNYCPAFASIARRAEPSYQRLERLRAEDHLLRNILLSPDEVKAALESFTDDLDGAITIL